MKSMSDGLTTLGFDTRATAHQDLVALPRSQRRKSRLEILGAREATVAVPFVTLAPGFPIALETDVESGKGQSDKGKDRLLGHEASGAHVLPAAKGSVVRVPGQLFPMQEAVGIEDRSIGAPDLRVVVQESIGHEDVAVLLEDFVADSGRCGYMAHEGVGHL